MKQFVHYGYDLNPGVDVQEIDDCIFDNTREPIVRAGDEPFVSYYPIEWCYNVCSRVDPSRSLVRLMQVKIDSCSEKKSWWPVCDLLRELLLDLGLDFLHPTDSDLVAFHSIFSFRAAELLSESYMRNSAYLARRPGTVRVINNPFFHKDRNASERRLVEICEWNGLRYSIDRTKPLVEPMVMADEIMLLNDKDLEDVKVLWQRNLLWSSIKSVLMDSGLM